MADVYEKLWNPQEYLQQYYATDYVADDEKANLKSMIQWLRQGQKTFHHAIDFGCGSTVHHVMPLTPYVGEIHLADYLPENLAEVRKWLNDNPDAHDWDVYLRGVLELESNQEVSLNDIYCRKRELQNKITTLKPGDIRQHHPLGDGSIYDLVLSFYCGEAVTSSKAEWQDLMSNLCRLVAPGGTLFLTAVRKAHFYTVMDKRFPTVFIDEVDIASVLQSNSFNTAQTEIQVVHSGEWIEQGFESICIIKAEKSTIN